MYVGRMISNTVHNSNIFLCGAQKFTYSRCILANCLILILLRGSQAVACHQMGKQSLLVTLGMVLHFLLLKLNLHFLPKLDQRLEPLQARASQSLDLEVFCYLF